MKEKVRNYESEGKICYTEREIGEAVNNARKSCKTSREKELFDLKRQALLECESEKLWREECCKFTAYRCNRW